MVLTGLVTVLLQWKFQYADVADEYQVDGPLASILISKLIGNGHKCENLGLLDSIKFIFNSLYDREVSNYQQNITLLRHLLNYNNYNENNINIVDLNNINLYEHIG
ncbi:hypothetical protein BpHYR1_046757 [Brachionus plicatilis]|uniref:Uncharacterized protein n=1 Tax=Brachionus plicatilis TaxID=10195 RepID=A0A3M7RJJ2_BRAPC|nr:hypothetical protein BpHYR1_046757 [Brachionus plicatilis]